MEDERLIRHPRWTLPTADLEDPHVLGAIALLIVASGGRVDPLFSPDRLVGDLLDIWAVEDITEGWSMRLQERREAISGGAVKPSE